MDDQKEELVKESCPIEFHSTANVFLGNHDQYASETSNAQYMHSVYKMLVEQRAIAEQAVTGPPSADLTMSEGAPLPPPAAVVSSPLDAAMDSTMPPDAVKPHATLLEGLVEVPRQTKDPISEWDNNAFLYGCAFPWIFPCGAPKHIVKANLPLWYRRLSLFQANMMCASEPWFYFLAMNQLQRHKGISRAKTVSTNPDKLKVLAALLADPDAVRKFEQAKMQPKSAEAKELMKTLTPIIRATGSEIPYSTGSQAKAISTMLSMCHNYGLPSTFLVRFTCTLFRFLISCAPSGLPNAMKHKCVSRLS